MCTPQVVKSLCCTCRSGVLCTVLVDGCNSLLRLEAKCLSEHGPTGLRIQSPTPVGSWHAAPCNHRRSGACNVLQYDFTSVSVPLCGSLHDSMVLCLSTGRLGQNKVVDFQSWSSSNSLGSDFLHPSIFIWLPVHAWLCGLRVQFDVCYLLFDVDHSVDIFGSMEM